MKVFENYAAYYNLLYHDKDYAGETDYIHSLIGKYNPGAKTILDLGCGTGRHDMLLAEKGYSVTGVDQSEQMLAVARALPARPARSSSGLAFLHGDIRTVCLGKTFDVVLSLFHVMSYQVTNQDLESAFATARLHLKPGGILIFDCWYGPAVLTERPSVRIKRMEDNAALITRIAEPVMDPNENVVDVHYHVIIREKSGGRVEELKETHKMRYLFRPEVEAFLEKNKLRTLECTEWMTGRHPGFDTWGVCFVTQG